MRIVGVEYDGEVHVANLSPDGTGVTVVAGLREFWNDPEGSLARPRPAGRCRWVRRAWFRLCCRRRRCCASG